MTIGWTTITTSVTNGSWPSYPQIPFDYSENGLTITALMKIKLLKRYAPDDFTFEMLKEEYGIYAVSGPRGIPNSLSEALK